MPSLGQLTPVMKGDSAVPTAVKSRAVALETGLRGWDGVVGANTDSNGYSIKPHRVVATILLDIAGMYPLFPKKNLQW